MGTWAWHGCEGEWLTLHCVQSFTYTQFRATIRRFCDQELAPHADRIDRENGFEQFREFWRKLGDMGLHGITAPGMSNWMWPL